VASLSLFEGSILADSKIDDSQNREFDFRSHLIFFSKIEPSKLVSCIETNIDDLWMPGQRCASTRQGTAWLLNLRIKLKVKSRGGTALHARTSVSIIAWYGAFVPNDETTNCVHGRPYAACGLVRAPLLASQGQALRSGLWIALSTRFTVPFTAKKCCSGTL